MVNSHVDELSVMTYISQFSDAKLKEGAPIKSTSADPSKVKAYGPGLEPEGLTTDVTSAEFTVDVTEAGLGKLTVSVESPGGEHEIYIDDKKNGTYVCSYDPDVTGTYTVVIQWGGKNIPNSPFLVNVAQGSDAYACNAYGPGLEGKDLKEGCETEFWVETAGAGEGTLSITIRGPKGPLQGDDFMRVEPTEVEGKFRIYYIAPVAGQYLIEILFGGLHIADSPYKVHVAQDRPDASKCRAEGDGVTGKDLQVGYQSVFWVYTKGAGRGELTVNIRGKSGTVPIECTEKEPGVWEYSYLPTEAGEYVITIKYGGENIPGSRFKVNVAPPTDLTKVLASGPGLEPQGVRVGIPTKFEVRTKDAGKGEAEVAIRGPNGPLEYSCKTHPYTYDYTYEATSPGLYTVEVKFAGEHIPSSPYSVAVTDTSKVRITGPGMKGEFLPINEPLEYFVDARGAGPGKVGCSVQGPVRPDDYDADAPVITDNEDGTFKIVYTPDDAGRLKMNATFAEAAIPDTPIKLHVYDASQVVANGKGLEDGNVSGELTHFTVDMRKGGEGRLHVGINGPGRTPVTIKDQANNVVNCEYIPLEAGEYDINILWEGVHIPNSPYHISIKPSVDSNAVAVYGEGLESEKLFTDMWAEFFIDTRKAGKGELQVQVTGPGGGEELKIEEVEDGLQKVAYFIDPEEAGEYTINVLFADQHIPHSPFKVNAAWKTDPAKVKAYGPGLEGGITNQWAEFTLDMSKAGSGGLTMSIEGPQEAEVKVQDEEDGTAKVQFLPLQAGEYKVNVSFADEPIPGVPFKPVFEPCTDASKVKAAGIGIEPTGVKVGEVAVFEVDSTEAGPGALECSIDGPLDQSRSTTPIHANPPTSPAYASGNRKQSVRPRRGSLRSSARAHITNNNDDTYSVQYTPKKIGQYSVMVMYDGKHITGSPYLVNISDPTKVKLNGPGVKDDGVQCVGVPLVYAVDTVDAGEGDLEVAVYGPEGCNKDVEIEKTTDTNYVVRYTPDKAGAYSVAMKYSGTDIPNTPVKVGVFDAGKVGVVGEHLNGEPIKVGTPVDFAISAVDAGEGELGIVMEGPSQVQLAPNSQEDGVLNFNFTPIDPGDYKINAKFGEKPVPGSPFLVQVYDADKVEVSGPAISGEGATIGKPALVKLDTKRAGKAPIAASVKAPNGEEIPMDFKPISEADLSVLEALGRPDLEAGLGDSDKPDGKFPLKAKVRASKPGDSSPDRPVKEDASMEIQPNVESGIYFGDFLPEEPGVYEVDISYGDDVVGDSPFKVSVAKPDSVKLKLPEVDEQIAMEWIDGAESSPDFLPLFATVGEPSTIDVHTDDAGPGKLSAVFEPVTETPQGEVHAPVDYDFVEVEPDHYQLQFVPQSPIDLDVTILYNDQPVGEPQRVILSNPKACRAHGPGLSPGLLANEETHFFVETENAGPGKLSCNIKGSDEVEVPCEVEGIEGDKYKVIYTPTKAGNHEVSVRYARGQINGGPFTVNICNPSAVKAYGPGLEKAILNQEAEFTIDVQEAGEGALGIALEGPRRTEVHPHETEDGTFRVTYTPTVAGIYKFIIKFADVEIPNVPFCVRVERAEADASKCEVKGIEVPGSFVVDASLAGGNGVLEVCAVGAFVPARYISVTHNGDYTFNIKYDIPDPGETWISVKWHGEHVPGSPFTVHT